MKIFQSLHHKILLVFEVCASIILLGFSIVYWITLEQHRSLEQHRDLPSVSINWFKLNKGLLRSTWAQHAFINSGNPIFLRERNLAWKQDIQPAFEQLGHLYKKSRVWLGERSVERRSFYDLRLMILDLKNIQQKTSNLTQTMNFEQSLEGWSTIEWPLVEKIISQIQLLVRWQNDFAKQQASELRKVLSGLGIWIWIIASLVLVFVLVIALFFAKRISDPLRKLRIALTITSAKLEKLALPEGSSKSVFLKGLPARNAKAIRKNATITKSRNGTGSIPRFTRGCSNPLNKK